MARRKRNGNNNNNNQANLAGLSAQAPAEDTHLDISMDEFAAHVRDYGDEELARSIIEADLAHSLKTGSTPIIGSSLFPVANLRLL